jgi:uncharacterized membrane protein
MYHYGFHPVFGFFDFVWHIAAIVFVVWLIVALVRMFGGGAGRNLRMRRWQMHSALGILDERYAKGEIGKEEYEERHKTLMGDK